MKILKSSPAQSPSHADSSANNGGGNVSMVPSPKEANKSSLLSSFI